MDLQFFNFSFGTHRYKNVIWINFEKDTHLINQLKTKFPSAKWSAAKKAWYLPDLPAIRTVLQLEQKERGSELVRFISPVNQVAFSKFIDQLNLKAYSKNTIRTYVTEFAHLLKIIKNYPVNDLTEDRLKDYFLYCVKKERIKENHLNSRINAIKFYFENVLNREKMFFDIPRPKRPKLLPKMLTKPEIRKIFNATQNTKHLLMLQFCYSMGLRVSEIVTLRIEHINTDDMLVLIAGAKGKKDRYTNLPDNVLPLLRKYYQEYKPKDYLFEGQYGGAYTVRSVQSVFKQALQKAKINKNIGVHGLKHRYTTKLIESGADNRFLKKLKGRNSLKTK